MADATTTNTKRAPLAPALHSNGSGYAALEEGYRAGAAAVRAALEALPAPHARDYYVMREEGSYTRAREEHAGRQRRLQAVLDELEAVHLALVEQHDARRAAAAAPPAQAVRADALRVGDVVALPRELDGAQREATGLVTRVTADHTGVCVVFADDCDGRECFEVLAFGASVHRRRPAVAAYDAATGAIRRVPEGVVLATRIADVDPWRWRVPAPCAGGLTAAERALVLEVLRGARHWTERTGDALAGRLALALATSGGAAAAEGP